MSAIRRIPCSGAHADFVKLVNELDAYLAITDGDEHDFYDQYNGVEDIEHAVIIYVEDTPVACGAIKMKSSNSSEIKRMYVSPQYRRRGLAKEVLDYLIGLAKEHERDQVVLETGRRQHEAVLLYSNYGFDQIPNYPPYEGMDNSICFAMNI